MCRAHLVTHHSLPWDEMDERFNTLANLGVPYFLHISWNGDLQNVDLVPWAPKTYKRID